LFIHIQKVIELEVEMSTWNVPERVEKCVGDGKERKEKQKVKISEF
jgi:hypothetical protein